MINVDRLMIDCVNDRAGVQNRYFTVPDLMSFVQRTGRVKNYTVWARKGVRSICIETDDPIELEKRLNEFARIS